MIDLVRYVEESQLREGLPVLRSGDTVEVRLWSVDGDRRRLQSFDGKVIAVRSRGLNSTFTVRRVSHGAVVERVFQTHSRIISQIIIRERGRVRRAKLYHPCGVAGGSVRARR